MGGAGKLAECSAPGFAMEKFLYEKQTCSNKHFGEEQEKKDEKIREEKILQLKDELKAESKAKESHKLLYASLLREHKNTRQQLTEARLHIDRLRLGTNADIHRHCIITHSQLENSCIPKNLSDMANCQVKPPLQHIPRSSHFPPSPSPLFPYTLPLSSDHNSCNYSLSPIPDEDNHTQCDDSFSCSISDSNKSSEEDDKKHSVEREFENDEDLVQIPSNTVASLQQISRLHQEIANLQDILQTNDVSFDYIHSQLMHIQQQHQELVRCVDEIVKYQMKNNEDEEDNISKFILQEEVCLCYIQLIFIQTVTSYLLCNVFTVVEASTRTERLQFDIATESSRSTTAICRRKGQVILTFFTVLYTF